MSASVSIDRTSLSLSPLVIVGPGDASTTYLLTKNGLGRPGVTQRLTYMPDSPYIHGSELLAAAQEQSSLPLEIVVQAATASALDAAVQALADAVFQFSYTVTVTPASGVSKTWACDPAALAPSSGGEIDAAWLQFVDVLKVTIPVYPIPS